MKDDCFEYTPKFENGVQTGVTITHLQTGQILEVESLFFKFPDFAPCLVVTGRVTHVIPNVTTFTGEPPMEHIPDSCNDKQGNNGC